MSDADKKKQYMKEWRAKNRQHVQEYNSQYRSLHKEEIKAQMSQYRQENIETVKNKEKQYRKDNKDRIREKKIKKYWENIETIRARYYSNHEIYLKRCKEYRDNHLDKRRDWQREAYKNKPNYKFHANLNLKVIRALLKYNISKEDFMLELVGCNISQLKAHLESQFLEGMSWDNHNKKGWEFDHIVPCAFFNLENIGERFICYNFRNLRPLWASDNLSKKDRLVEDYDNVLNEIRKGMSATID